MAVIVIFIICLILFLYHIIVLSGVALNSFSFYKFGLKKTIIIDDPIEYDIILKNIKISKSNYRLLNNKHDVILIRELFNMRNIMNHFLKLRAVLYRTENEVKAVLYYDPAGFILALLWISVITFPMILSLFLSGNFTVVIFAIICIIAIEIFFVLRMIKEIKSYDNLIKAILNK